MKCRCERKGMRAGERERMKGERRVLCTMMGEKV